MTTIFVLQAIDSFLNILNSPCDDDEQDTYTVIANCLSKRLNLRLARALAIIAVIIILVWYVWAYSYIFACVYVNVKNIVFTSLYITANIAVIFSSSNEKLYISANSSLIALAVVGISLIY